MIWKYLLKFPEGLLQTSGEVLYWAGLFLMSQGLNLFSVVMPWCITFLIQFIFSLLQSTPLLQVFVMVCIVVLQFSYNRETVQMQLKYLEWSHCVFDQVPSKMVTGVAGGIDWKWINRLIKCCYNQLFDCTLFESKALQSNHTCSMYYFDYVSVSRVKCRYPCWIPLAK